MVSPPWIPVMNVIFQDLQAPENPLNGSPLDASGVNGLLSSCRDRPPFLFELKAENGALLTVGLGGEFGAAQYGSDTGLPPFLMATADGGGGDESTVEFWARGVPTRVLKRYCLAVEKLQEVVGKFLEDGTRLDGVRWEEI